MFDLDASKIVIVGVAALVFIPPKDLPRVMRQVGQFVGKMRRMANEFQGQFMDAMREADMADLRKEAHRLSEAARVDTGLNSAGDLDRHMQPLAAPMTAAAADNPTSEHAVVPPSLELGGLARSVAASATAAREASQVAPAVAAPEPQHTS